MLADSLALPLREADLVTGAGDRAQRIKAIVGASSGNLVEWYDFYAYAFTSIYFAAAFFPSGDATSQLMATAAKDHEAITANIPVFGEVKGQRVVYAYPDDFKKASEVRVKDPNAKGALTVKK